MIPWPVFCLLSILDSGSRTIVDTGHAVSAIFAPRRFAVGKLYIIERTHSDTFPTGDTFPRCTELFCSDKYRIKHRIDDTALYPTNQWRIHWRHLPASTYNFTGCTNRRLCGCDDHFCFSVHNFLTKHSAFPASSAQVTTKYTCGFPVSFVLSNQSDTILGILHA